MLKLLAVTLVVATATAGYSADQATYAHNGFLPTSGVPLSQRISGVWPETNYVEDRRAEKVVGFVFLAPDCAYCKK